MTHDDEQLRRMFAGIDFASEPPENDLAEDLRRAQRGHRRHLVATWTSAPKARMPSTTWPG